MVGLLPKRAQDSTSFSAAAKFRNTLSSSSQGEEVIHEISQLELAKRRRESIKATETYLGSCNQVSKEHPGRLTRERRPKPATQPKARRLPKPVQDLQKAGHIVQLGASLASRRASNEQSREGSEAGPSHASGVGSSAIQVAAASPSMPRTGGATARV